MKENELKVNSTGIWLKTKAEKMESWRARITDFFKLNGFRFLTVNQQTESVHVTLQKGKESIILNYFTDGRIQLTIKDVDTLLEKFLPQMENSLDVKFKHITEEGFTSTPPMVNITTEPQENDDKTATPIIAETKTENNSSRYSRISSAGRQVINRNERRFIDLSIQHDELVKIKSTLDNTEDTLAALRADVTNLRDEFNKFKKALYKETWAEENLLLKNMKASNDKFMKNVRKELANHVIEMIEKKDEGNAKIQRLEEKIRENKLNLLKMTMEEDEIDVTDDGEEDRKQEIITVEQ